MVKTLKIKVMKNELVFVKHHKDLNMLLNDPTILGPGLYRRVHKCASGFMVAHDFEAKSAYDIFKASNKKTTHSIARVINGSVFLLSTVYARQGKKIWIAPDLLKEVTVGDINQDLSKTGLYSHCQYVGVNAKSWADKAYVMNSDQ